MILWLEYLCLFVLSMFAGGLTTLILLIVGWKALEAFLGD